MGGGNLQQQNTASSSDHGSIHAAASAGTEASAAVWVSAGKSRWNKLQMVVHVAKSLHKKRDNDADANDAAQSLHYSQSALFSPAEQPIVVLKNYPSDNMEQGGTTNNGGHSNNNNELAIIRLVHNNENKKRLATTTTVQYHHFGVKQQYVTSLMFAFARVIPLVGVPFFSFIFVEILGVSTVCCTHTGLPGGTRKVVFLTLVSLSSSSLTFIFTQRVILQLYGQLMGP
jgi:hypothetical protein